MIHLTYFSPRLLQHWGCPAGTPMARTWGQQFCPYSPREATRAQQTASGHGSVPTAWLSPSSARPVGIPEGTQHLIIWSGTSPAGIFSALVSCSPDGFKPLSRFKGRWKNMVWVIPRESCFLGSVLPVAKAKGVGL